MNRGDPLADRIRVGIAGWSYDDWNGIVYPRGVRDRLAYIAPFVDVIEIDSSFYRVPSRATVVSWLHRTADLPHFRFTAKIPRDITHASGRPPDWRAVDAFLDAFEPAIAAGRLTHALAQFRYDYTDTPATRGRLVELAGRLAGHVHLTLELRHRSWEDAAALAFLRERNVTVAALDYPLARDSFALRMPGVGDHAYLRLHGRNAKAWFDHDAGRDATYDYRYDAGELRDIAARAIEIARMSKSLTLVANNHYKGKEVANALQIKAILGETEVGVPEPLAATYPDLDAIRDRKAGEQKLLGFDW